MSRSRPNSWRGRWRSWLAGQKPPVVACEVAADGVAAARCERGGPRIEAWAARPLPEGAVRPGPLAENLHDAAVVELALREVLEEVAGREKSLAVILPDLAARVWLLALDNLPARPAEAEALLRWRLAKEVAFNLEGALLSWQTFPLEAGVSVLVAAAQRSLVRGYEERFEALGFEPSWVTLATPATLGWLDSAAGASRLLIRRDPSSLGLAIVRGEVLEFFRSVPVSWADGSAEALFEQVYPALVYFEDQQREKVGQAMLVGVGEARAELARLLEDETGCRALELDVTVELGGARGAARAELTRSLAAAVGFLRAGAPA